MKNLIFIILFLSQIIIDQEWKLQESVPFKADRFVGVDSYKYLYWIKDNVLYKQEGESTYSFNNKLLGSIQSVDITNPFTVLVFYYQAQVVVVLDNKLNEIVRVDFSEMSDIMQVATIGNTGSKRLWIGNTTSQRLELFDYMNLNKDTISSSFYGDILEQE